MNISGAVEKSPSFMGDVACVWSVWEEFLLGANSVFESAAVSVAQMKCWGECLLGQNRVNKVLFGRVCS